MSLNQPKAIFWDWDGTIVDSYGFLDEAHSHTLVTLGFEPFAEGEYRQYFGKPREILYPLIYKDCAEDAKAVFQAFVMENAHRVPLIAGCTDVLAYLHDQGVMMGVVSNKKASLIAEEMKHKGLERYFSVLVGAGDAQRDKPSAEPLELAIEKAELTHLDCADFWLVGDTENDLACAQAAGVKSILYEDGHQDPALKTRYHPAFSFKDYTAFQEFLVAIYCNSSKT